MLERCKSLEELKIAMVPFTGINFRRFFEIEQKGTQFFITHLNDEEQFINKTLDTLDKLIEERVDIVVFPEMTFTSRLLKEVREFLRRNQERFLLIVCGSVWENQTNRAILLNGNGFILSH